MEALVETQQLFGCKGLPRRPTLKYAKPYRLILQYNAVEDVLSYSQCNSVALEEQITLHSEP